MAYFAVGSGSYQQVFTPTLNPASVAANTVATEDFTVTGVRPDTMYLVSSPSEAGLFVIGAKCTTANTLTIVFFNPTGAPINAAAQQFNIIGL